jgi:hypothetical protein
MHNVLLLSETKACNCKSKADARIDISVDILETLRREVAEGFLDSHARANKNAAKALEIGSFCYALIELLEEKGLITYEELNERKKVVNKRLVKKFADQGLGVIALQDFKEDKYRYAEQVQIDCASRVSICRAACCRLDLALSRQDLEEGIIKWDLGRPYLIARDSDDYCRHLDRATCRCNVWRHRPIPCRGYDCRQDDRIWLDFEKRIINPDFDKIMEQRDDMAP